MAASRRDAGFFAAGRLWPAAKLLDTAWQSKKTERDDQHRRGRRNGRQSRRYRGGARSSLSRQPGLAAAARAAGRRRRRGAALGDVRSAFGRRIRGKGWIDEFTEDASQFKERHYREFVSFLPYVSAFLYGEGRSRHASRRMTRRAIRRCMSSVARTSRSCG
jgi:hypothetical protein